MHGAICERNDIAVDTRACDVVAIQVHYLQIFQRTSGAELVSSQHEC